MIKKSTIIKERDYWKKEAECYKELYDEASKNSAIDHVKWIEHYGVLMKLEKDGVISSNLHKIIHEALYERDEYLESFMTREFERIESYKK